MKEDSPLHTSQQVSYGMATPSSPSPRDKNTKRQSSLHQSKSQSLGYQGGDGTHRQRGQQTGSTTDTFTYKLMSGDRLATLGVRFGVTPAQIMRENKMWSDSFGLRETIRIPMSPTSSQAAYDYARAPQDGHEAPSRDVAGGEGGNEGGPAAGQSLSAQLLGGADLTALLTSITMITERAASDLEESKSKSQPLIRALEEPVVMEKPTAYVDPSGQSHSNRPSRSRSFFGSFTKKSGNNKTHQSLSGNTRVMEEDEHIYNL